MINYRLVIFFSVLFGIIGFSVAAQSYINWKKPNTWVDSVYNTLTPEQRIAQLMMVPAWSGKDSAHIKDIACQVGDIGVGGIIFFKGTPHRQAALTNYYQSLARVPLIIGIDGEWGLSMRLDSTPVFPRQMVMGAAKDEQTVYEFGKTVGQQCRRMGIHFNFAPDVDVNNNPLNPVINDRSFGENRYWVAKLGVQYMRGMQEQGVIASAKHFPGHGDVSSDSHYSLPLVAGNRKRLDSLELYPFKELIQKGVLSIMSAHLAVPALDSTPNLASSLSKPVITDLLKTEMGFEGLVVTDALNMRGVADYFGPGEVAARALMAGNDILLFVEDVPAAIAMIKVYMERGLIIEAQLEAACKKVLRAKHWAGLAQYKPIPLQNLIEDLNCCDAERMIHKLVRKGIVVAKNDDKIIPIENPHFYNIACVAAGQATPALFQEMSMNYIRADYFSIDKTERPEYFDSLWQALSPYNLIILSLHNTSRFVNKNHGLTVPQTDFINRLLRGNKKVVLVSHGNPYMLRKFENLRNVIVAYEDLDVYNYYSAQVLFGGIAAEATLPVTVSDDMKMDKGIRTPKLNRFSYVMPEDAGVDHGPLKLIDTLIQDAILKGAMPGCQVLVAKDGKVFYHKSFGKLTYNGNQVVKNYHVYDVASLTKILATTMAIMNLVDAGKINVNDPIGKYIPELAGSNKAFLSIAKIMMHEAGLVPYVPFYKKTMNDGRLNPLLYSTIPDSAYTIPVARQLYLHKDMEPWLWKQIIQTELKKQGEYVYSDLGFILLRKAVENITSKPFDVFLHEQFYKPLNLSVTRFNPLNTIPADWIAPTENDSIFRKQLIWGTVHDQTAAMLGGVSGHAGLFSNANDVAVIMQMLMNGGTYGGQRLISESVVKEFNKRHNKNSRRGYGFDKPETDPKKASPVPEVMSPQTFGHTGFTGTAAWADPKHDLVIVFLSNRVHPSAENKKLTDMNIRSRIIELVYEAIKHGGH
jgi:beta-glucosidase-like glycosyl hydrolase/CubicO group peptidase (beta-lactamase class C family)